MDGRCLIAMRAHPTTVHLLRDAVQRWPEREAVVCEDQRLTYDQYGQCVAAFAQELMDSGAAGERVALVLGNGVDICVATFAVHAAGAQVVPLNPLYTPRELASILKDAAPRVLVYDASASAVIEPLLAGCGVQRAIRLGGPGGRRLFSPDLRPSLSGPLPDPQSLATLQYTGGTTGRSKGVNLTHRAVAMNVAQRDALLPSANNGERILCTMPLFHSYASAMCLHNAANCGGAIVILPRFTPEALFDLTVRERITILAGSPTIFMTLMKSERFSAAHFAGLRICYSGAAPLPEALLRRWEEATGAPVLEGYGQSESGPVLSFNPLNGVRKPQSVGVPLPQTEIQIVDSTDETRVLQASQIGEIRARGPQIMQGYRNRPEETAQALRNGWLYTGDLGEFDRDGYLYIRDRKKDMVLVSGFNVYPREIEEVLCSHPEILEAAVIGVADEEKGARIKAYVVRRASAVAAVPVFDEYCRRNLAAYKVPREYVFVERLPKTAAGKTDKKQLR
jgi:long-chain acyl-CoA synthetase